MEINSAANFLRNRKCIFCSSLKVLRTSRGYVKCRNCGKSKNLSRLRREWASPFLRALSLSFQTAAQTQP